MRLSSVSPATLECWLGATVSLNMSSRVFLLCDCMVGISLLGLVLWELGAQDQNLSVGRIWVFLIKTTSAWSSWNSWLWHRDATQRDKDSFESKDVDFCWQVACTGYFLAWIYIRSDLLSFILLLSVNACQCSKFRYPAKFGRFTNLSIPRRPDFLHIEVMGMPSVSQRDALM